MALFVTEHAGPWSRYREGGIVQQINGAGGAYSLSSAGAVVTPQVGTKSIRVSCDAATAMLLNTNTPPGSTGTGMTSTNSFRISPNAGPEWFAVSTGNVIRAQASTS